MRSLLACLSWLALVAAIGLLIGGCGHSSSQFFEPSVYVITITPANVNAVANQQVPMSAVVTLKADGSVVQNATVTWGTTGDVGAITADGVFTASATPPKSGTITASYAGDSGSVPVSVNATGQTLASITVQGPAGTDLTHVASGTVVPFTATGVDTTGAPMAITPTWSVSGGIGQIDQQGKFTAVTAGSGSVVATVGTVQGSANVTVVPGTPVTLTLTVAANTDLNNLVIGQQVKFTAYDVDNAGNRGKKTRSVAQATWSVTGGIGQIDQQGNFIATALGHGTVVATKDTRTASLAATVSRAFVGAVAFTKQNLYGNLAVISGDGTICDLTTGNNHFADPAWSPDASKLAFVKKDVAGNGIYGMNADGSGLHLIYASMASDPAWSPDGTKIAFVNDAGVIAGELIVISADGANAKTLAVGTLGAPKEPAWSHDGTKVAFVIDTGFSPADGVYLMNADGTGSITRLYTGHPTDIAWKPGADVLVVADGTHIYLVTTDGADPTLLTTEPQSIKSLAWSPDGSSLIFSEAGGSSAQLVLKVLGTSVRLPLTNLTNASAEDPSWK